jgi:hypothetical protein
MSGNHSILGWYEVSSWSYKGGTYANCAQESELLDDKQLALLPKKGWCFNDEPLENMIPHVFCMNFMMGSMEATLRDESQQNFFYKHVTIGPTSSRMPMTIARVMMYVKPMHKGLL